MEKIPFSAFQDNQFYKFSSMNVPLNNDEEWVVKLTSDQATGGISAWQDKEGNCVASYFTQKKIRKRDVVVVNLFFLGINAMFSIMISFLKKR